MVTLSRAGIEECHLIQKLNLDCIGKKIQGSNVSEYCLFYPSLTRGLFSGYHKTKFLRPTEINGKKVLILTRRNKLETAKKIDSLRGIFSK